MHMIFYNLFLFLSIIINETLSSNTTYLDVRTNYDETKEIVQNCLNEVLNALNLNEQVKRLPKVQLLLIMHENLNNVLQHKWKVTIDIKNMVRAENCTATKQVYEYVDEAIMAVETENLNNETETNAIEWNLNTSKATDFFSDLFSRINKQSIMVEDTYKISVGNADKWDYEEVNERRMNVAIQTWQPDEPHNETRRVYGGRPVGISQYPFIASVHVLGKFSCSGSIISSNFVITAASCLQPGRMYKASQQPIEVRIGSDHARLGGELLPAVEVIFHPRYDPVNLVNNLAMIKVKSIQHGDKKPTIKKIRMDALPKNLPKDIVAKGVFILGWGDGKDVMSTKNNQHLTSAFLDLQSLEDCIDIYTAQYVTDKNFCAGLVYKGSGACNGDIGGPAIVLGTLVGIVSFGPPACGTVSDPTVFTKLGYYASWINDVINEKIPKARQSDRLWLSDTAFFSHLSPIQRNSHEEMLILRQLVHELDQPGNKISEIIEEDQELDDEMKIIFQTTTPVDAAHHILLNNSVVVIPGLHIPSEPTEVPVVTEKVTAPIIDIGLPDIIPYDQIEQLYGGVVSDSIELRYFVSQYLTKGTLFKAQSNLLNPKQEILTSIETNENFEYESSDGMSIEVPADGILRKNKALNIEVHPKGMKVKSHNDDRTVFDLGEQQHFFNIGGKIRENLPKMQPKDIWSDVMRLRQLQKRKGVTSLSNIDNLSKMVARNSDISKQLESMYFSKLRLKQL